MFSSNKYHVIAVEKERENILTTVTMKTQIRQTV